MTSLLASPQQGADAAATALVPTVAACTSAGRSTAAGGSAAVPATGARDVGSGAELTPGVPCLTCGADSLPGDDLCRSHGGMTDGIERHAAMRAVA